MHKNCQEKLFQKDPSTSPLVGTNSRERQSVFSKSLQIKNVFFDEISSYLRFVNKIYPFFASRACGTVVFVHFFVYFDISKIKILQIVNLIYLF